MISFQGIWALLKPEGEYKRRCRACARLWDGYAPEMQQRIYDTLHGAKQKGEWINPNPYFAIEDTALRLQKLPRCKQLSYAEYYRRYGTTEEQDGWQRRFLANEQKTIYVKAGNSIAG
jgi:hypothetical protein